jgi:hypothetical protein
MWHHPAVAFCAFDAWLRPLFDSVYTDRKCVLFGVACCRAVGDWWGDPRVGAAVDAAERFADTEQVRRLRDDWYGEDRAEGQWADAESAAAFGRVLAARDAVARDFGFARSPAGRLAAAVAQWPGWQFGSDCCHAAHALSGVTGLIDGLQDFSAFAPLLRDVFPNPYRPVAFAPRWRTATAVALARGMYESRDFGAMPILADALEDADCDGEDVLAHCRGGGPHVRGCWVVDLVLGKE